MTIDPRARASWHGFLDLMRPPRGYRIESAVGTTFGMSFEALTAALLSMLDADPEQQVADPVATVIALTRLAPRVRVLLHPGTIEGTHTNLPTRIIGMFDRMLVQVPITNGLFHPKVWLLRFRRAEQSEAYGSVERARVIVASRNLTRSNAFELGVALDGEPGAAEAGDRLGDDVGRALGLWLRAANQGRRLDAMAVFAKALRFQAPPEGEDAVRLHVQGVGQAGLHSKLPNRLGRVILVSPFLRPELIRLLLARSTELRIVSNEDALEELDDDIFAEVKARSTEQASPVLFAVGEHGDPEDAHIDGLHAKLLIADDGAQSMSFIGSANGTGPGWGLAGQNVEAMLELRPGLRHDAFLRAFILDEKKRPLPWLRVFERGETVQKDEDDANERRLLGLLRRVAARGFELGYDRDAHRLRLQYVDDIDAEADESGTTSVEVAPLSCAERDDAWCSLAKLARQERRFDGVELADVTGFVVLRAQEGNVACQRIALGMLRLSEAELDERDGAAREAILTSARPEELLRALVLGLGTFAAAAGHASPERSHRGSSTGSSVLEAVSLEAVLRAVAEDPALVRDIRLVLGPSVDPEFQRFCDELDVAANAVQQELEG